MNKKDLAKTILERNTTLDSQAQVARILDSMIDIIAETLATGEKVDIKGLVKFKKVKI
jgi:nucleoid DNA-binding protein